MATTVAERPGSTVHKNARWSQWAKAKRPLPATKAEADELFRPHALIAPAGAARLHRLNALGLLHPEGRPITQGEAHTLILDALYPDE